MKSLIGTLTLACVFASACKKPPPPPEAKQEAAPAKDHVDESSHEELPSRVRLTPEVVQAAGIKTAPVESAVLPVTLDLSGEIAADPDASAQVTLPVQARIVDVRFKEGQTVKAGDILVVAEAPDLARARAALSAARAKRRPAKLNAERLEALAQKGLAAGQEVAAAKAEADSAEAEEQAARHSLSAFGTAASGSTGATLQLKAPIDGFVLSRDAIVGQTLAAEHLVARIARFDSAYFLARVFEKDLGRIRVNASAEVKLNAYPDEVFVGTVESVGRQLDEAARTVIARVRISDKQDRLREGLFGSARISMPEDFPSPKRPVAPTSSITKIANRSVVFVQQPDGDFEVHPVELGRSAAGRTEILSGLREGEQLVVEGVFTLKSAVLRGTFGEDE